VDVLKYSSKVPGQDFCTGFVDCSTLNVSVQCVIQSSTNFLYLNVFMESRASPMAVSNITVGQQTKSGQMHHIVV